MRFRRLLLDEHLEAFGVYLKTHQISDNDILIPAQAKQALDSYKDALSTALAQLKTKRDKHPELLKQMTEVNPAESLCWMRFMKKASSLHIPFLRMWSAPIFPNQTDN